MSAAVFWAAALTLWRDRGALALVLALPPLVFAVFAAAFSSAGGADLHPRVAAFDAGGTPASAALLRALAGEPPGAGRTRITASAEEVREMVRRGLADAGLLIGDPGAPGRPAATVVADPGKAVAAVPLVAAARQALARAGRPGGEGAPDQAVTVAPALPGAAGTIAAGSCAAGVAVMFLLFSAAQGALTLIEERDAGTLARAAAGPGGVGPVLAGKFGFLAAQGLVQCALVFAAARALYGVDALARPGAWLVTSLAASSAAAALALGLCALCRTRPQAQAASTFLVLLSSAVGGSMAPRFAMPAWLGDAGWWTPNAQAIAAYEAGLWRGGPPDVLLAPWLALLAATALGLLATAVGLRRDDH